jgi:tRNA G10  N-methylase Trm11
MKKFASILFAIAIGMTTLTSSAFADVAKGQKFYLKFMKDSLNMNGAKFASLHSQDEWEEMFENGKFEEEFGAKSEALKKFFEGDKWQKMKNDIKDFAIEYANDSGNVPSC